ncbi:MAG: cupin domain-containing protein [Candidatus Pacebacteria bacterium]|nr:cupin domain-containing protein [Candidatus Paceibacterota bacterium]
MKIIHKDQTKVYKNSDACTAIEYPLGDKDINGAVIELDGRYPDRGRTVNLVCKEMAYIIKGFGKLVIEDKETELREGDLVLIEVGEKFFWEGNMRIFMPCTPAWYPEQHKEVE